MKKTEKTKDDVIRDDVIRYVGREIPHKGDIVRVVCNSIDYCKKYNLEPNKLYRVTHVDFYMNCGHCEFFVTLNNGIKISAGYLELVIPYNFDYSVEIMEKGDKTIPVIFVNTKIHRN